MVVVLVALGLTVYRRLQSAEGWEAGRGKAASVIALGVVLFLGVPMIPGVSYAELPQFVGTQSCITASGLEYCVSFETPQQIGLPPPSLGSSVAAQVVVSVFNEQPVSVTSGKILVIWSSGSVDFNVTRAEFGPVDVPGRVAKNLLDLADRFGSKEADGLHVHHDLTQEELAQLVGASRETVNKALADFAARGWLQISARSVLILDTERLRKRAR